MISREEAIVLLKKYLKDEENINKSYAVELILKKLARVLNKDEELWGLTGLLHNIDYEYTLENPEQRGTLASQMIGGLLPDKSVNAVKGNNYMHTDYVPVTSLDKCLIATVTMVDLLFAIIKSTPLKNISDVNLRLVTIKYKDPDFAQRFNRKRIEIIADIEIEIEDFFKISLDSLIELSNKINF